jgi:peptide/nickel transport system substrate-binding protein
VSATACWGPPWTAPDLRKARALIASSGTRGTPITIWSEPAPYLTDFTSAGRYLVSLLGRLGYPARIKTFSMSNAASFFQFADSRMKGQAFLGVLVPNFPAASEFLGPQLQSCERFVRDSLTNLNLTEFCDKRLDTTVRRALAAEAARSPTAAELWARADRQYTDQAPVVPLMTPSITDLVSRRVGNYLCNPQLGVLLDQLWVH